MSNTKNIPSDELAKQWFGNRNLRPGLSKRCGHITDGDVHSLTSLIEQVRREHTNSDCCSACGIPYEPEETRTLQADGTTIHEASQPSSMVRCRNALLAKLRER